MLKLAVILCAFVASSSALSYSRCTNSLGALPTSARITGCGTGTCVLRAGNFVTVEATFTAPQTLNNMVAQLTAFPNTWGTRMNVGTAANVCNNLGGAHRCPIGARMPVQYRAWMTVDSTIVRNRVMAAEFRIVDQSGLVPMCFRFNINVV